MSTLLFEIEAISALAESIMQAILQQNEKAQEIMGAESAPLELTSALSDFYLIAATVESGDTMLEADELAEFSAYGLDLHDRLDYMVRQLELMDLRSSIARVFPSLALWLARQDAVMDNLQGAADGFAVLVNGLTEADELAEMCGLMEEVIDSASVELQKDEDKGNPWRPWRILNLNTGIAATRSLNPDLMERIFDKISKRLPEDMSSFFADGKRQMAVQNVPDEVVDVMKRYADKWSSAPTH